MSGNNSSSLTFLRKTLGLSQGKLADTVGCERDTIRRWEKGTSKPQSRYKKRLNEIFDEELTLKPSQAPKSKDYYDSEEAKLKESLRRRESINRSFTVGKSYMILTAPRDVDNPSLPILRYERKDGIHHVFREVRGKWTVTYTDAQLVGKIIEEAKE